MIHIKTIDEVLEDIRVYAHAHSVSPGRVRDYFLIGIYAEGRLVPSSHITQGVVAVMAPDGSVPVDVDLSA